MAADAPYGVWIGFSDPTDVHSAFSGSWFNRLAGWATHGAKDVPPWCHCGIVWGREDCAVKWHATIVMGGIATMDATRVDIQPGDWADVAAVGRYHLVRVRLPADWTPTALHGLAEEMVGHGYDTWGALRCVSEWTCRAVPPSGPVPRNFFCSEQVALLLSRACGVSLAGHSAGSFSPSGIWDLVHAHNRAQTET